MTLSVVTPCLDAAPYLAECLASVRAGGAATEHIVMDGGSRDGTLALLEAANGIQWSSAPDAGQSDAINRGLARTTGEILCYLCADDLFESGALDSVASAFEDGIDVVYGDGCFLEGDSGWKRLKRAGPFSYARLRRGNFLIQPAVFFRRRVYERFGGFDPALHYCMDHEYWLRIGAGTTWRYLPEPLATSRLHGGAKTSRDLARAWAEAATMQRRYGIRVRPALEALWMRLAGRHFYALKRVLFRRLGHLRRLRG